MTRLQSFWVSSKNERFDHSSNIYFFLISYLAIIIVKMRDFELFIISFMVYHLINQTVLSIHSLHILEL